MFPTNQVGTYFIKQRTFIWYLSFLKISENHEKFVEKVDFYSSIRIRIQSGNLNPDPTGSGTLPTSTVPVRIARKIPIFCYSPPGSTDGKGVGDSERIDVDVLFHVVHGGIQGSLHAGRHVRSFVIPRGPETRLSKPFKNAIINRIQ